MSEAASGESAIESASSLPASEDAPTMPIRNGLPAITNSLAYSISLLSAPLPRARQSFSPALRRRLARSARMTPTAPPGICQAGKDTGNQVTQRDDDQHVLRLPCDKSTQQRDERDDLKWLFPAGGYFLRAPEPPIAHHQKSGKEDQRQPNQRNPGIVNGRTKEAMNDRRNNTGSRRDRHSHKKLTSRFARITRLRIDADVEAGQTTRAADKKDETREYAAVNHVLPHRRIDGHRQHAEPPDVCQQTRRNA